MAEAGTTQLVGLLEAQLAASRRRLWVALVLAVGCSRWRWRPWRRRDAAARTVQRIHANGRIRASYGAWRRARLRRLAEEAAQREEERSKAGARRELSHQKDSGSIILSILPTAPSSSTIRATAAEQYGLLEAEDDTETSSIQVAGGTKLRPSDHVRSINRQHHTSSAAPSPLMLRQTHSNAHERFHNESESAVSFLEGDCFRCLFFSGISIMFATALAGVIFVRFVRV